MSEYCTTCAAYQAEIAQLRATVQQQRQTIQRLQQIISRAAAAAGHYQTTAESKLKKGGQPRAAWSFLKAQCETAQAIYSLLAGG